MAAKTAGDGIPGARSKVEGKEIWRIGSGTALAVAAINVTILLVAKAAGIDFSVPDLQGEIVEISAGQVAIMSLGPLLLGTAAIAVAVRLNLNLRWVQAAGVVLVLASFVSPLALDSGVSTKLVLSSMHVVSGLAFIAATQRLNRGAEPNSQ